MQNAECRIQKSLVAHRTVVPLFLQQPLLERAAHRAQLPKFPLERLGKRSINEARRRSEGEMTLRFADGADGNVHEACALCGCVLSRTLCDVGRN